MGKSSLGKNLVLVIISNESEKIQRKGERREKKRKKK
jgi:hypothetical protein